MLFWCRTVVVAVMMFTCVSAVFAAGQDLAVSDKVARVGNLAITQGDVGRRAQAIMPMQLGFHGSVSADKITAIKQQALDELIARAYKVQYAIDEEISVDGQAFEQEWQKRLSKIGQVKDAAQQAQVDKLRADIYLDMLAMEAEAVAVNRQVVVTDEEVAAYYAANKAMYFRPRLYKASHIFVRVDPASNAEEKAVRRERAEALLKRAQAGEDFYNLAYYESDDRSKYVGGSLGSFHAGQTVAEFDAAIQAMQPGEIAGPVRTIYGFHVIKLDAMDEERQLEFDEVAAKIRTSLVEARREQKHAEWMTQLKEKYPLERLDQ